MEVRVLALQRLKPKVKTALLADVKELLLN
jgi:hypothetical protein